MQYFVESPELNDYPRPASQICDIIWFRALLSTSSCSEPGQEHHLV